MIMDVKDIKIAQLQKELLKQKEEVKKLNKKLATSKKKVANKQKELRSIKKKQTTKQFDEEEMLEKLLKMLNDTIFPNQ